MTTPQGVKSAPLEVVLDPRLKATVSAEDIAAHWDLVSKADEDIEALHRAVNQMRASRTALADSHGPTAAGSDGKELVRAAAAFNAKMTPIEEQLIQVNMKASEDNLRYPNRLNEQYDTFIGTADAQDVRPTEPQLQVFAELHSRLSEELAKWKALVDSQPPALNSRLQHSGEPDVSMRAGQ
jgi:hypothetical protein